MKGLGAGFHQPVDGLHCLSEVSYISQHYCDIHRIPPPKDNTVSYHYNIYNSVIMLIFHPGIMTGLLTERASQAGDT